MRQTVRCYRKSAVTIPLGEIVNKCAKYWGIDAAQILERNRNGEIVKARHSCWAILDYLGMPCTRIGREFQRDHTTVLHGIKQGKRYDLNAIMEVRLGLE